MRTSIRRLLLRASLVFIALYLVIYNCIFYEQYSRIEFASAVSPDGGWTIKLTKEWMRGQVRVSAEAYDRDGNKIGDSKQIDLMEHWSEPETTYPAIYFTNDEVRVGEMRTGDMPSYRHGDVIVKRSDFYEPSKKTRSDTE